MTTDLSYKADSARVIKDRKDIIASVCVDPTDLPTRGSSFFIHLTELCPVACPHCMYASTLTAKSVKDSLNREDLAGAIQLINESRSLKLNITGGGEPFLKVANILRLVEIVDVPRIEIVTAGHWARTVDRAASIFNRLSAAKKANPAAPDVLLRLSFDRYHIEAPRPVALEDYANVVAAWRQSDGAIDLGLRSILPDKDTIDLALARMVDASIETVNDWNRRFVFADGEAVPITYNILRFSGSAESLDPALREKTPTPQEYYKSFESADGRLSLGTAVNDAIRGAYTPTDGVALTLNSDGAYWIFTATAPDRRLMLGQNTFDQSIRYFFQDPITHLLVRDGLWALVDLVRELAPDITEAALAKNDVAFLVEDLLTNPFVSLDVTRIAARRGLDQGWFDLNDKMTLTTGP